VATGWLDRRMQIEHAFGTEPNVDSGSGADGDGLGLQVMEEDVLAVVDLERQHTSEEGLLAGDAPGPGTDRLEPTGGTAPA
jgi:hypothetical protein